MERHARMREVVARQSAEELNVDASRREKLLNKIFDILDENNDGDIR